MCDERICDKKIEQWEDRRRAKHPRGKGLVAWFERDVHSANDFDEPGDLVRSRSREAWYAASQASRQPPSSSASMMELFMRTAHRHHDLVISLHRKIMP